MHQFDSICASKQGRWHERPDSYPHVLESLPGSSNIGIGLRRSYDDDAVPSLTEMMDSDVYKDLSGNPNFQFAKVKDEERNLAIDKWGLTRMTVNDNIPDDETSADSSIEEETEVEVIAESAADDDELPPHTGEPGGWSPTA